MTIRSIPGGAERRAAKAKPRPSDNVAKRGDEREEIPHAIGRFRPENVLGQGAYGVVLRAFDTELERPVALKLAWPHVMFDAVASRRFIEEPKAAAALNHRGIVKVYDSGWIDSVSYIALELVDGPTLGEWLAGQTHVPYRVAVQIVHDVAEAVHFAHARGIVHRDLKPSNILLRPGGQQGPFPYEPVVGDFGLARRPRMSPRSNLTGTLSDQRCVSVPVPLSRRWAAGKLESVNGPAGRPRPSVTLRGRTLTRVAPGASPQPGVVLSHCRPCGQPVSCFTAFQQDSAHAYRRVASPDAGAGAPQDRASIWRAALDLR
ncbi:MAG: serine/threonine protein kinase [Planctomycetia bacterium]|nr:serine/threonine protein kinase [Planctomycetia bacterium]